MSFRDFLLLGDDEKKRRGLEFMPREIAQQPGTWRGTFRACERQAGALLDFLRAAGVVAPQGLGERDRPTMILSGAGTSAYAGASLASLLRAHWGCDVRVVTSPDLLVHARDLLVPGQKYFFMSFSRSGMSPESVAVARQLAEDFRDARQLAVTCNPNGLVAKEFAEHPRAMCVVLDDAVNDRALAMTSSFSNMVVAGQFAATLSDSAAYGTKLDAMADAAERFLDVASQAAESVAGPAISRVCFLGSGALHAVAQESALKVLEMTAGSVATLAESFLGVRHGPLAFVDRSTLVVGFLSGDQRRRAYELDLLEEVQQKRIAHSVVAVGHADDPRARSLVDIHLALGLTDLPDDFRPPIDVIFSQLLALYLSIRCGLSPDAPSANGAIQRVVSGVRIHT